MGASFSIWIGGNPIDSAATERSIDGRNRLAIEWTIIPPETRAALRNVFLFILNVLPALSDNRSADVRRIRSMIVDRAVDVDKDARIKCYESLCEPGKLLQ
jgi:hypothetical protein